MAALILFPVALGIMGLIAADKSRARAGRALSAAARATEDKRAAELDARETSEAAERSIDQAKEAAREAAARAVSEAKGKAREVIATAAEKLQEAAASKGVKVEIGPAEIKSYGVQLEPAKEPPKPSTKKSTSKKPDPMRDKRNNAKWLLDYVTKLDKAGKLKSANKDRIKKYQAGMKGVSADGLYGPKTRARAAALLKISESKFPAPVLGAKTPAALPAKTEPQEPAKETTTQSARAAAEALFKYATQELKADRPENLGSKQKPSSMVKAFQMGMRNLTADGIYGPKTRARGKELLGKPFPVPGQRVAPATPAAKPAATEAPSRSPKDAAEDLAAYARDRLSKGRGADLGTKNTPSSVVRDAQRDMGGGIVADGIYGPGTRKRGQDLGVSMPARA